MENNFGQPIFEEQKRPSLTNSHTSRIYLEDLFKNGPDVPEQEILAHLNDHKKKSRRGPDFTQADLEIFFAHPEVQKYRSLAEEQKKEKIEEQKKRQGIADKQREKELAEQIEEKSRPWYQRISFRQKDVSPATEQQARAIVVEQQELKKKARELTSLVDEIKKRNGIYEFLNLPDFPNPPVFPSNLNPANYKEYREELLSYIKSVSAVIPQLKNYELPKGQENPLNILKLFTGAFVSAVKNSPYTVMDVTMGAVDGLGHVVQEGINRELNQQAPRYQEKKERLEKDILSPPLENMISSLPTYKEPNSTLFYFGPTREDIENKLQKCRRLIAKEPDPKRQEELQTQLDSLISAQSSLGDPTLLESSLEIFVEKNRKKGWRF